MTPAPRYADKSERDRIRLTAISSALSNALLDACDYLDARLREAVAKDDERSAVHPNMCCSVCKRQIGEAQAREAALFAHVDKLSEREWEPRLSDAARELLEKARRWDNFNEAFDRVPEEAERLYADLTKAKAERDAYREDAERYRALMQTAEKIWKVGGDREVCVVPGFDSTKLWVLSRQEYEKDREDAEKWRESKQLVDADMAKRLDALQRENAALREVAEAAKHVANDPEWRRLVRTGDMSNLQRTLAQLRDDAPEGER